mgnify:CR=1 FL=1
MDPSRIAARLLAALLALFAALTVQIPSSAVAASPFPKAAGPRQGPLFEVTLELADRSRISALAGFDVTRIKGETVLVSATKAEVAALRRAGFAIREVRAKEERRRGKASGRPGWSWDQFHDHAQVTTFIQDLAARFPQLVRVESMGRSVEGRELWAVKITDNPDQQEVEPEVRFAANIHGDEVVGVEMILRFMDQLTRYYGRSRRVTALVDSTELWFVPMWNPDGNDAGSRYNANGYDLNRVFPDEADSVPSNLLLGPPRDLSALDAEAPEISAFMRFSERHRFVLGLSFHGGAVVTVYPWSTSPDGYSVYTPTPDDGLFIALSKTYASRHLPMRESSEFPGGFYNSANWYTVNACSQDWAYKVTGMFDLDIELSEQKWPSASSLRGHWAHNQAAMLALAEASRWGIHGVVTDSVTGRPVSASVKVEGYDHLTFTDPDLGDYHRPLQPGTYTLLVSAPGYATREVANVAVFGAAPTRLDVTLEPVSARPAYKIDFRPADGVVLEGFEVDNGRVFGPRGNGLSYGWDAAPCLDSRRHLFSQDASFDAFADMQGCAGRVWELAVPNGSYRVRLVAGDAAEESSSAVRISVEDGLFAAGTTAASRWAEGSVLVTVADGRLTLRNAPRATRNALCAVEVIREDARSGAGRAARPLSLPSRRSVGGLPGPSLPAMR